MGALMAGLITLLLTKNMAYAILWTIIAYLIERDT